MDAADGKQVSIDDVDFSTRTCNALAAMGISTLGELSRNGARDLLRCPNLGKKSLAEIERILSERGMALGTPRDGAAESSDCSPDSRNESDAAALNQLQRACRLRAIRWHQHIADLGCPGSHNILGYVFQTGAGLERNPVAARRHYLKAARAGHALAAFNLATLYLSSDIPSWQSRALRWMERARERGLDQGSSLGSEWRQA